MLGRSTGLIIANTVIGAGLGFAALKIFALETGSYADDLLGQLAFAMGIAGLLSITLDLGLNAAHVKRVSEGRDLGDAAASFAAVKFLMAGAFVALATAAAFVGSGLGILQDTPRLAVVLVAVSFAFLGLRTVFTATFEGRGEFAKSQTTVLAENLTRVALMVLFALAFAGGVLGQGPLAGWLQGPGGWLVPLLQQHSAEFLAASYAVAAVVSFIVGALLFRRGYPFGRIDRALLRDYWGFGRHVFLAGIVGTIYASLDKVVVTAFWDPSHTGQYFGAQRFSDLITMVPLAVYTVLFPALSAHYARGSRAEVRGAMEAAVRHVSLAVVPLVVFALALAGPLLSLVLTGVFSEAVPTLRLLALYALVYALMYPYAAVLQALDRPGLAARAAIVATLVNAVLNLALVPPRGAFLGLPTAGMAEVGAALATLIAVTVQFLLLRRYVDKLEGAVSLRHFARHAVAGLAMGAVLWPLAPPAGQAPWWLMLGLLLLGGAVYLVVLAALREFTRRDLQLYLSLLNPGAMARHVADEVQSHRPGALEPEADAGRDPRPGTER
jgi:O-antigen/teichoic acid export membrane protein